MVSSNFLLHVGKGGCAGNVVRRLEADLKDSGSKAKKVEVMHAIAS